MADNRSIHDPVSSPAGVAVPALGALAVPHHAEPGGPRLSRLRRCWEACVSAAPPSSGAAPAKARPRIAAEAGCRLQEDVLADIYVSIIVLDMNGAHIHVF